MGDRDGGEPVPLSLPGRAPFSLPEPALVSTVGGRVEPAGTRRDTALPVECRGAGASGGGGAGTSRTGPDRRRPGPAAPAGRLLATLARDHLWEPDRIVRSGCTAVAAVRGTARA